MLHVISRPPNDEFTYNLFCKLLKTVDCDCTAYYIWTNPPHMLKNFFEKTDFSTTPNVIIGIKDMLDMWLDFNYWHDRSSLAMQLIDDMAHRYPNTNFVIVTSVENFANEPHTAKNLQFLNWGGDWTNQVGLYKKLDPVLNKDFSSTKSYISLNRNRRAHRIITLSYLFGQGIDRYGVVSDLARAASDKFDSTADGFMNMINWEFDEPRHDAMRSTILNGFQKYYNNPELILENEDIYVFKQNDNLYNFENKLRPMYQQSFVEIVSESSFVPPNFFVTEKTAHCFYGCNFPIILGGIGIVDHLRTIGFDMFDDVINHSYDQIANPFDRITAAIDNNHHLLVDAELAKTLWKKNQLRFVKNVKIVKQIDRFYKQRLQTQWSSVNWK